MSQDKSQDVLSSPDVRISVEKPSVEIEKQKVDVEGPKMPEKTTQETSKQSFNSKHKLPMDKILYYAENPTETPDPRIKNMVRLIRMMKNEESSIQNSYSDDEDEDDDDDESSDIYFTDSDDEGESRFTSRIREYKNIADFKKTYSKHGLLIPNAYLSRDFLEDLILAHITTSFDYSSELILHLITSSEEYHVVLPKHTNTQKLFENIYNFMN